MRYCNGPVGMATAYVYRPDGIYEFLLWTGFDSVKSLSMRIMLRIILILMKNLVFLYYLLDIEYIPRD